MDNMEASCIFYVKVGMLTYLEQSKMTLLTLNTMEIVRLAVQHELIVSASFMQYPRDDLGQTSTVVLSLEVCPIYI